MSTINEERENEIKELDTFIGTIQARLKNIVSALGWTFESISNETRNSLICPFNNGHRVREESLIDHLEKCQWKAEGYTEHDLPLSEPCPSVNSSSVIKFDEQLQEIVLLKAREENPTMRIEIYQSCAWNALNAIAPAAGVADRLIPRSSDRLMANFTTDERKAIYDYVIANTIKTDIGDDIADMNRVTQKDGDQPKTSLLELLAQERNLKRRRAKHRGVHTNKKSQVEILREVIQQQMEMYEEYITESSVKSEPKSPSRSEAGCMDDRDYVDRKTNQQTKYETEWPKKSSSKYSDRGSNPRTFLPTKKSPKSDFSDDRDQKRNRSESRERGKKKHHSKHKRDRSKERNRHEEDGKRRHHTKEEEKSWNSDKVYKSEVRNDRRKRHRSRDRNSKYQEKSRRRDKSHDKYINSKEDRNMENDKNRKRYHH